MQTLDRYGNLVYEKTCKRCDYGWTTQKELPRVCPKCRSPYWNKEPIAKRYPEIYALKPGESVVVPWPENHVIGTSHPAYRIVSKLNKQAAAEGRQFPYSCWKFDGHGATVTRLATDVPKPAADNISPTDDNSGTPADKLI